jgi:hypothetical protein
MQYPDQRPPSNHDAPQGLPPVKPPSGRFILQLFLIPGLIVVGLVLVFAFGSLTLVGTSTPESFLTRLDNSNPDVRWRAASDLAQVLSRPESLELASNPDFALAIAERLSNAFAELKQAEKSVYKDLHQVTFRDIQRNPSLTSEEKVDREKEAYLVAWRKLRPQRDLVRYLTGTLGEFTLPVGVNVLGGIAMKDDSPEIKGLSMRRRQALWALVNLGSNMQLKFFGKNAKEDTKVLSAEQKKTILDKLVKIATEGAGQRRQWAEYAHEVLTKKAPSKVDDILAICASADDIFLREVTAQACNFWDGPKIVPTLVLLARDDGHGDIIRVEDDD